MEITKVLFIFVENLYYVMDKKLLYNILEEKIKQNLPSSLEQKLLSYHENRSKWLYYSALINQEQCCLMFIDYKICQGFCTLHDIASRNQHKYLLKGYQDHQFNHFRSMCCDALDFVNGLYRK